MPILKSSMKYLVPFILLVVFACGRPTGNLVVDKDLVVKHPLLKGTFSNKDTTVHFVFNDCSGSLTQSGIIIRHQIEFTIGAINLTALIQNDYVDFLLETKSGYYGDSRKFHLQDSLLILTKRAYNFGDSVQGKINISGYGIDSDGVLKIEGTFKCALTDSLYRSNEFEKNLND